MPPLLLAHAFGGRADLPLPAWMFGYGAAAAVVISFAALGIFWQTPRLEDGTRERPLADTRGAVLRVLSAAGRVLGLVVFVVVLVAAAVGDNSSRTNLAPAMVYIAFWVGVMFLSGLIGDVWRVVNPFDTLAAIGQRVSGRRRAADDEPTGPDVESGDYDEEEDEGAFDEAAGRDWGYWPAALFLLVFVWVELAYPDRAVPRSLFTLMVAYTVVVLAATARYGRDWLQEGEAFTALFGVVAHAAPLYRGDDGKLRLRPPFAGLAGLVYRPGLEALVLVALGSTSFDGVTRTQFWLDQTGNLGGNARTVADTVGLLCCIGLMALAYVIAMWVGARLVGGRMAPDEMRAAFVHSLVPIALAYSIAHYFSLLVFEGQSVISLSSDPLGRGWDLFGTASRVVDFSIVSTLTVAYVQCAAIVVGHVAGVVMAHDRALVLFDKRTAARSQYPLLAVMVLFTVSGLLLLLGG